MSEFYGYGNRRVRGARNLDGVWREWHDIVSFGPRIEVLTLDDMDKVEADKERAARYVTFLRYCALLTDAVSLVARNETNFLPRELVVDEDEIYSSQSITSRARSIVAMRR